MPHSFLKRPRSADSWSLLVATLPVLFLISVIPSACPGQEIDFNAQVRPILSRHCISCHGPDEETREAGLRIDVADEASYVIEPGDAENSEAFRRILADDPDEKMPPPEHGDALNADEIEVLRTWIEQGANYATHWSFVAPRKPDVPQVKVAWLTGNEIDLFVSRKLVQQGLRQSPPADPARLIRRVALDLTGLPPSQEQVQRFVAQPNDATYEQIVDELLGHPGFGEHWAGMWLDLARYADTIGYAEDKHRSIWPWRDWVIRAFNSNMPYDQFTVEQIAGDLLPEATENQRLATAFHRNTLNNTEGGTSDEEFRVVAVKDRINTTVNVWMGLTMRCAECHSHKYDPISQKEYYQFLDFFNQTVDSDKNDDRPRLDVFPAGREKQLAQLEQQIAKLESLEELSDPQKKRLEQLVKQFEAPVRVPVMQELPVEKQRPTHVMMRGSHLQPTEEVSAAVMTAFHDLPGNAPVNRLGVARWLVSEENPLTARVAVNRFWARLFGAGIVETEEDFGTQGSAPSHPDLLDWLAVDFREHGWNVKRLLKQMVMSATYRQSCTASDSSMNQDPRNRLLSRGPRVRLRAEVVRDQALAVAGLLSSRMYGPPVYPPNPVKRVVSAFTGGTNWVESQGEDRYRRAIYTYLKRSAPHPLFDTFDMATREVCNLRRIRTNTPLQAFMTLNGQSFIEAAQALAASMRQSADDPSRQIQTGFDRALFRAPTETELQTLLSLYAESKQQYLGSANEARLMAGLDETSDEPDAAELAALTVVANVILNLDEFLTK